MGKQQSSGLSWAVAAIVLAAIVGAGVYVARRAMHADAPASSASAPAPATSAAPAPAASAAAPVQHPIGQAMIPAQPAAASTAPVPALEDSDASVAAALAALAGGGDLRALLLPQQLVARIVATVDALPRKGVSARVLPVRPPRGSFAVDYANGRMVIGAGNAERYAPYMRIVDSVDARALVAWYAHFYPLFQQAYEQLGYPGRYFNDRLVAAIDDMLDAPEPAQSPALAQPSAYYTVYADPNLEGLSAGQKMLIRVGPADEARIKAKLREIRAALTGRRLP